MKAHDFSHVEFQKVHSNFGFAVFQSRDEVLEYFKYKKSKKNKKNKNK